MANAMEENRELTERLFDALALQKKNPQTEIIGLKEQIARLEASMTKEQIAWVKLKIDETL